MTTEPEEPNATSASISPAMQVARLAVDQAGTRLPGPVELRRDLIHLPQKIAFNCDPLK